MNKYLCFILLVMISTGCTLAPQYRRPPSPVPDQWAISGSTAPAQADVDGIQIQNMAWREFYIDESLKQLIETALANNRDLRLAALNVERARGLYGIQRAELLPAVNAVGLGGKQHQGAALTDNGKSVTLEEYRADLRISAWEIDFFGRIQSLTSQALEEYLATEQARNSAQILLISSVAQAYLALAADRQALQIAASTFETQQAAYDLMAKQFQVGMIPELDLHRVHAQVESARGDMARFRQQIALDENALTLLLGGPIPAGILSDNLNNIRLCREIFPRMGSEVLFSRPDILGAEHRLKGAHANIGAARAMLFPRISLTTAMGTASKELSGLFESGSGTWSFTPQVSLPIFDARIWAALAVSKTDQQIALTQYEKTIQTAFKEVADVLAALTTIQDQLSAQQALCEALAAAYRLTQERYNKGVESYLSVLDAQRSLYAAEQGLVALQLAKGVNQVRLYAVLGGGTK